MKATFQLCSNDPKTQGTNKTWNEDKQALCVHSNKVGHYLHLHTSLRKSEALVTISTLVSFLGMLPTFQQEMHFRLSAEHAGCRFWPACRSDLKSETPTASPVQIQKKRGVFNEA